jgi:hypothetical protein
MFKRFRHKSGQSITAEVVITFVLVTVVVAAMSTYIRRTMQGRVRDAIVYVRNEAETATMNADGFVQDIPLQYEPYYAVAESATNQMSTDTSRIDSVNADFVRDTSQGRIVISNSVQLAPKDRD